MKVEDKVYVKNEGVIGTIVRFVDDAHAEINCRDYGYTDTYPIKNLVIYDKSDPFFKNLQEKVNQVSADFEKAFEALRDLKEQRAFNLPEEMLDISVLCDELEENGWSSSSLHC